LGVGFHGFVTVKTQADWVVWRRLQSLGEIMTRLLGNMKTNAWVPVGLVLHLTWWP